MNAIFAAALEIETICRAKGFQFCFIGGLAVQRWGQPRMTADVDLTLLTGFGGEAPYIDALLSKLRGRIPDARQFALRYRTVVIPNVLPPKCASAAKEADARCHGGQARPEQPILRRSPA
jgi:hypothetical protein